MYTLCGRGPRSSLRVLRHGLEVTAALSRHPQILALRCVLCTATFELTVCEGDAISTQS